MLAKFIALAQSGVSRGFSEVSVNSVQFWPLCLLLFFDYRFPTLDRFYAFFLNPYSIILNPVFLTHHPLLVTVFRPFQFN